MAKKIFLFFDGTSNKFKKDALTNVFKAYDIIQKDESQIACYVPGVGSIADKGEFSSIVRLIKKYVGLGFGYGLQEKVLVGYDFLIDNYEEGDDIYLLGFSRGAYTAKVLAGLIHTCGLIGKHDQYNSQYAYAQYAGKSFDFKLNNQFKKAFSKYTPKIEFMGLWDSVSSVGDLLQLRNYPYTTNVKGVKHIRHAMAIDERRFDFTLNKTNNNDPSGDIQSLWFAGVHTDVGGGNPESESGLAKIALLWMLEQLGTNVNLNNDKLERFVTNITDPNISKLDALADAHKNGILIRGLNIIPRIKTLSYDPLESKWVWPLFFKRSIPKDYVLHESVKTRMAKTKYYPKNLPKINYS